MSTDFQNPRASARGAVNTEMLKKIQSRCEEVGDCLEWQGHISATGSPRIYHDSRMQSARKLMLQAHGKPSEVPLKHKLVCTCENHRCVNADHIAIVPLRTQSRRAREPPAGAPGRIEAVAGDGGGGAAPHAPHGR